MSPFPLRWGKGRGRGWHALDSVGSHNRVAEAVPNCVALRCGLRTHIMAKLSVPLAVLPLRWVTQCVAFLIC